MTRRVAITVQNCSRNAYRPPRTQVLRWIKAALGEKVSGELTLRIVDEQESAELNTRYRQRQGATNVLAFPADAPLAPLEELAPLGDLVVCAPVLEREATEQGKSLEAHWAHVLMHGTLHLRGYDHQTPAAAEEMESLEKVLLARFGFADPYI